MTQRITLILATFFVCTLSLQAQSPNVSVHIQQIAKGWQTDAKKALPDLLIEYPNDPNVMFLHASLVEDTKKAIPLLQRIVEVFPKSEWADDALARIVIYACLNKDSDNARKSFIQMREQFPQSELLPVTYDVVRSTVGLPPPTGHAETAAPTAMATTAATASTTTATPVASELPATVVKRYTLQTRSTYDKKEADGQVELFKKKRMRVELKDKQVKGKKQYVVLVGDYDNEVEAAKDLDIVRSVCKCKPTVVVK